MIERIQAYKASDGTTFPDLAGVQLHELATLLRTMPHPIPGDPHEAYASTVIANKDKVLDILTTGPKSLPKARKINGGTKVKKKDVAPTPVLETSASN